jgi:hypothetical protein
MHHHLQVVSAMPVHLRDYPSINNPALDCGSQRGAVQPRKEGQCRVVLGSRVNEITGSCRYRHFVVKSSHATFKIFAILGR